MEIYNVCYIKDIQYINYDEIATDKNTTHGENNLQSIKPISYGP